MNSCSPGFRSLPAVNTTNAIPPITSTVDATLLPVQWELTNRVQFPHLEESTLTSPPCAPSRLKTYRLFLTAGSVPLSNSPVYAPRREPLGIGESRSAR